MNKINNDLSFTNFLKGRIEWDKPAREWTWLKTGGAPLLTFYPQDIEDLKAFCKHIPNNIPYRTIGAASNILVRDNGYNGIFIRLTKGFREIEIKHNQITASAGLLGSSIINIALENDLGGIAFMATIPGMLGGLIKMNAGAHGLEMQNIIEWVEFMDEHGEIHRLSNSECEFQYRHSKIANNWIILKACINATPDKKENIAKEINKLIEYRQTTQPTGGKMAGCFFKNPPNQKAWELIKKSHIQETPNVCVSSKHANFIMNKEHATAFELEHFALQLQANIFFEQNIWLEMEIDCIGY